MPHPSDRSSGESLAVPRDWLILQFEQLNARMTQHSTRSEDNFKRIDARFDKIETVALTVASHATSIEVHRSAIDEIRTDVKDVTKKSAFVSGVGALLAILVGLLPLPWKH